MHSFRGVLVLLGAGVSLLCLVCFRHRQDQTKSEVSTQRIPRSSCVLHCGKKTSRYQGPLNWSATSLSYPGGTRYQNVDCTRRPFDLSTAIANVRHSDAVSFCDYKIMFSNAPWENILDVSFSGQSRIFETSFEQRGILHSSCMGYVSHYSLPVTCVLWILCTNAAALVVLKLHTGNRSLDQFCRLCWMPHFLVFLLTHLYLYSCWTLPQISLTDCVFEGLRVFRVRLRESYELQRNYDTFLQTTGTKPSAEAITDIFTTNYVSTAVTRKENTSALLDKMRTGEENAVAFDDVVNQSPGVGKWGKRKRGGTLPLLKAVVSEPWKIRKWFRTDGKQPSRWKPESRQKDRSSRAAGRLSLTQVVSGMSEFKLHVQPNTGTGEMAGQRSSTKNPRFKSRRGVGRTPMSVNCQLHLVADELFYQNVGQKDERRTVRIMKDVIRGADAVFRSTDFDQDGVGDNIGFLVTNITIIKTRQQSFMPDNTDNDHLTYLENFSRLDQSAYCLAVAFTYREFEQGVGGVAWIASASLHGEPGGICQRRVYVNEEAAIFSFNTLAITLLTHGQRRSLDMAVRTLTHEFGHSFGSTHDEGTGSSCGQVGVSRGGTFLMNHYSTSGDMPNNRLFSPCSRGLMYPVIVKNGNCLQRYSGNRCGDGVLGDSEECDCGTSGTCQYNDPCCTPADVPAGNPDPPCTVRRSHGKECSPATSECCTSECRIRSRSSAVICKEATECHDSATCDGQSARCPVPVLKPNGTICKGGARLCVAGACSGSVCEQHGMEDCLCVHSGPARCKLCCKTPGGSDFDCTPADVLGIRGKDNTSIYLPTFEPCKGPPFGFCDKRRQCVPHLDLASSIFAKDREGLFARWFLNHWPYLLNLLGLLIIGVITFNVCGDQNSKDAHVTAVRYGKVLSFFSICQEEKRRYHQNIRLCRLVFGRFQAKLLTTNLTQTLTEAVGRLRAFFPTCPLSHLLTTITSSTSEDVAVRILLAQGYAMRQFTRQPGGKPAPDLSREIYTSQVLFGLKNVQGTTSKKIVYTPKKEVVRTSNAILAQEPDDDSKLKRVAVTASRETLGKTPEMEKKHLTSQTKRTSPATVSDDLVRQDPEGRKFKGGRSPSWDQVRDEVVRKKFSSTYLKSLSDQPDEVLLQSFSTEAVKSLRSLKSLTNAGGSRSSVDDTGVNQDSQVPTKVQFQPADTLCSSQAFPTGVQSQQHSGELHGGQVSTDAKTRGVSTESRELQGSRLPIPQQLYASVVSREVSADVETQLGSREHQGSRVSMPQQLLSLLGSQLVSTGVETRQGSREHQDSRVSMPQLLLSFLGNQRVSTDAETQQGSRDHQGSRVSQPQHLYALLGSHGISTDVETKQGSKELHGSRASTPQHLDTLIESPDASSDVETELNPREPQGSPFSLTQKLYAFFERLGFKTKGKQPQIQVTESSLTDIHFAAAEDSASSSGASRHSIPDTRAMGFLPTLMHKMIGFVKQNVKRPEKARMRDISKLELVEKPDVETAEQHVDAQEEQRLKWIPPQSRLDSTFMSSEFVEKPGVDTEWQDEEQKLKRMPHPSLFESTLVSSDFVETPGVDTEEQQKEHPGQRLMWILPQRSWIVMQSGTTSSPESAQPSHRDQHTVPRLTHMLPGRLLPRSLGNLTERLTTAATESASQLAQHAESTLTNMMTGNLLSRSLGNLTARFTTAATESASQLTQHAESTLTHMLAGRQLSRSLGDLTARFTAATESASQLTQHAESTLTHMLAGRQLSRSLGDLSARLSTAASESASHAVELEHDGRNWMSVVNAPLTSSSESDVGPRIPTQVDDTCECLHRLRYFNRVGDADDLEFIDTGGCPLHAQSPVSDKEVASTIFGFTRIPRKAHRAEKNQKTSAPFWSGGKYDAPWTLPLREPKCASDKDSSSSLGSSIALHALDLLQSVVTAARDQQTTENYRPRPLGSPCTRTQTAATDSSWSQEEGERGESTYVTMARFPTTSQRGEPTQSLAAMASQLISQPSSTSEYPPIGSFLTMSRPSEYMRSFLELVSQLVSVPSSAPDTQQQCFTPSAQPKEGLTSDSHDTRGLPLDSQYMSQTPQPTVRDPPVPEGPGESTCSVEAMATGLIVIPSSAPEYGLTQEQLSRALGKGLTKARPGGGPQPKSSKRSVLSPVESFATKSAHSKEDLTFETYNLGGLPPDGDPGESTYSTIARSPPMVLKPSSAPEYRSTQEHLEQMSMAKPGGDPQLKSSKSTHSVRGAHEQASVKTQPSSTSQPKDSNRDILSPVKSRSTKVDVHSTARSPEVTSNRGSASWSQRGSEFLYITYVTLARFLTMCRRSQSTHSEEDVQASGLTSRPPSAPEYRSAEQHHSRPLEQASKKARPGRGPQPKSSERRRGSSSPDTSGGDPALSKRDGDPGESTYSTMARFPGVRSKPPSTKRRSASEPSESTYSVEDLASGLILEPRDIPELRSQADLSLPPGQASMKTQPMSSNRLTLSPLSPVESCTTRSARSKDSLMSHKSHTYPSSETKQLCPAPSAHSKEGQAFNPRELPQDSPLAEKDEGPGESTYSTIARLY